MLIAIDHGNSNIKTTKLMFPSHFDVDPVLAESAADWILLDGHHYVLSNGHMVTHTDKTSDQNFLVLTYFAIAKQIEVEKVYAPNMEIHLAVGLPPADIDKHGESFKRYLQNGQKNISFTYNGKAYQIRITKVSVYPQAYSADNYEIANKYPNRTYVDIGGYTVDTVAFKNGQMVPALSNSLENEGMIKFYARVNSLMKSKYGEELDAQDIDNALTDHSTMLESDDIAAIKSEANNYITSLIDMLGEKGFSMRFSKFIFVGGGSIRMETFINSNKKLYHPIVDKDQMMNAKGYYKMASINEEKETQKK